MPGAKVQSREEQLREWAEAIERGEMFEADPEETERFKREMESTFKNVQPSSQFINAIAGDTPRRGVE